MKYIQFLQRKVIERTKDVPYLRRWTVFGIGKDSSIFSVKVHHILISDDACMHDHPWPFLSIILKGGYVETSRCERFKGVKVHWDEHSRLWVQERKYVPGNILWRPANSVHKLTIDKDKTCWTMVFTFRKIKSWGFFTPKGFIDWRQYRKTRDC